MAVQEQDSIIRFEKLANTLALNKEVVFQYQRHNLQIRHIGSGHQMTIPRTGPVLMNVLEDVVCEKVR